MSTQLTIIALVLGLLHAFSAAAQPRREPTVS
jgi:hypothetical protein